MSGWQVQEKGDSYFVVKGEDGNHYVSRPCQESLFYLTRDSSNLLNCEKSLLEVIKIVEKKNEKIDKLKKCLNKMLETI